MYLTCYDEKWGRSQEMESCGWEELAYFTQEENNVEYSKNQVISYQDIQSFEQCTTYEGRKQKTECQ